jgi:SHS2 domain-containing protein
VEHRRRRGHRSLPHTADLRLLVWAPTREDCVAEAMTGLVESFADTTGWAAERNVRVDLPAGRDEEVLVAALEEVIYRLDTGDGVPVTVGVTPIPDGRLRLDLGLVGLDRVRLVGPAPKAVTWHELRFERRAGGGWSCVVTVDV